MLVRKKDRKKEVETYYLEEARRASAIFPAGDASRERAILAEIL
jgi:hypothetical protein